MSQERVALSLGQFPIPERHGGYCPMTSQERVALSLGQFPIPERRGGYCQRMSFLAGNLRWTLGVGRGRLRGIRSETYSQFARQITCI